MVVLAAVLVTQVIRVPLVTLDTVVQVVQGVTVELVVLAAKAAMPVERILISSPSQVHMAQVGAVKVDLFSAIMPA